MKDLLIASAYFGVGFASCIAFLYFKVISSKSAKIYDDDVFSALVIFLFWPLILACTSIFGLFGLTKKILSTIAKSIYDDIIS